MNDDQRREHLRGVGRHARWKNTREILDDGERRRGRKDEGGKRAPVGTRLTQANGGRYGPEREQHARAETDPRRGVPLKKRRADPQKQAGRQKRFEQEKNDRQQPVHDC